MVNSLSVCVIANPATPDAGMRIVTNMKLQRVHHSLVRGREFGASSRSDKLSAQYLTAYLAAAYLFFSLFFSYLFIDIVVAVKARSRQVSEFRIEHFPTKSTKSFIGLNFVDLSTAGRDEIAYEIGLLQQMDQGVQGLGKLCIPESVVKDGRPEVCRPIVQRIIS
jgi:hypothetical protein